MNNEFFSKTYLQWANNMEETIYNTPNYLLQKAGDKEYLQSAAKRVKRRKGSSGIDGIPSEDAEQLLNDNIGIFEEQIKNNTYIPTKTRKFDIPKDNGEFRTLSIPTVSDRIVQCSLTRVLDENYDTAFSDKSFGYRKGLGISSAIDKAIDYANAGKNIVIDMDIRKFFDSVHKDVLLEILQYKVKGKESLELIRKFLDADIYQEEIKRKEKSNIYINLNRGLPQGGPISAILANIYLNYLDMFLENKGIDFVRYADDCLIFTNDMEKAQKILKMVNAYLRYKLVLELNFEKTKILPLDEVTYLGMSFYKNKDGKYSIHISNKTIAKYKKKLQEIIMNTPVENLPVKLEEKMRGQLNYVSYSNSTTEIYALDRYMLKMICQRFENPHLTYSDLKIMGIPLHKDIWKKIKKYKRK